jgi:hypothetical protein
MTLLETARQFLFVREVGGPNRGVWVEIFQKYTGNAPGDSWCASFLSFVLGIHYQGGSNCPLSKTASCEAMHQQAKQQGWITAVPLPGDVVLSVDATGHAHHVALVTATSPLTAIAGNTDAGGVSSNGDRVAEHGISAAGKVFVRVPLP